MSDEEYHPPIARATRHTTPVPPNRRKLFGISQEARLLGYYDEDGRHIPATNTASRRRSKNDLKASTGIPTGQNGKSGYRSSSTYRHQSLDSPSAGLLSRLFRLGLFLLFLYVAITYHRYQLRTRSPRSRAQMIRDSQPPLETLDIVLESFQELQRLPGMLDATTPKDYDELFKALNIAPSRKRLLAIKQDLSPLASLLENMDRASLEIKTLVMAQKLYLLTDVRPSMEAVVDVMFKGLDGLKDEPDWIDGGLNALSIVVPVIQRHYKYDPYIGQLQVLTNDMDRELNPLLDRSIKVQKLVHDIILEVEWLHRYLEGKEISFASKCIPSSSHWIRGADLPKLCSLDHISQVLQENSQALQNLRFEVLKSTMSLYAFQEAAPPFFMESREVLLRVSWNILDLYNYSGEKQKVYDKLK